MSCKKHSLHASCAWRRGKNVCRCESAALATSKSEALFRGLWISCPGQYKSYFSFFVLFTFSFFVIIRIILNPFFDICFFPKRASRLYGLPILRNCSEPFNLFFLMLSNGKLDTRCLNLGSHSLRFPVFSLSPCERIGPAGP